MSSSYHVPVMGHELLKTWFTSPSGIYLDGTLGGGGHAEMILKKLQSDGLYIGIDRDADALEYTARRLKSYPNFRSVRTTFDHFADVTMEEGIKGVDGVLMDLGVSSFQIDTDARGFAFRRGLPLDMRMDDRQDLTAGKIVNSYSEAELKKIFREYGEERYAGYIAKKIVKAREIRPIEKTDTLIDIIDSSVNAQFRTKSYARIFQALRIEVNDEFGLLKLALIAAVDVLQKGGRLAVITFHSLEDRIVKQFFQTSENPCICPPELPVCACGREPKLKRLRPFFRQATEEEINQNPRSRSAKLRVTEKIVDLA